MGPKPRARICVSLKMHLADGSVMTDLVEVDSRLPVLLSGKVEVSHTNLTEVTGMVFIHVGSVVVLTTSKTSTTGMLSVLALYPAY